MKEGIKVIAIHAQTGEQIPFARVKEAAIFAGVKPTTMSYRIRSRTIDSKGYYYISGELSPEQDASDAPTLRLDNTHPTTKNSIPSGTG